ncbi:TolC family protein [Deinococcus oregonensis]|uniref:TolC family protein n=1 Tax=Deinococcus oregonensis TaxID=1805970 RepID=A0ABV6B1Z0_9DEIO
MSRCPPPPLPSRAVQFRTLTLGLFLLSASGVAQTASPLPSLTLEDALARLAEAPSVTAARLSVQVAQQNYAAARNALGLSVSVNGSAGYSGGSASTAADGSTVNTPSSVSGSAGVQVSLGLLPWASSQTGLQASARSLTLAEARLSETQASTRLNVYAQYLAAVVAGQDVALANQTLAFRQRQQAVAQAQADLGNATPESVLSAGADVLTAQASALNAAADLDAARRNLAALLNVDLTDTVFSSQPPSTFTLPDLPALVTRARMSSRAILQARNDLADAQDTLNTQQRDANLPTLNASLRYGPAGSGGLSANLNVKDGTAGVGYTLPLGGSAGADRLSASLTGSYVVYSPGVRAQVSAAQASVTQAQLSLNAAQSDAELNVRTRYSAAQTATINLKTSETQVQVAQAGLDAAGLRLSAGTGTQDDVTAAQIALAQAQRNLLQARSTAQQALVQLENSVY